MTAEILQAARQNNLAFIQTELPKIHGDLSMYTYPDDNLSPLHWAVYHNNSEMLTILLDKCHIFAERKVLLRDNSGLTAIEYAAKLGYWNCLKVFLVRFASPFRKDKQYYYTGMKEIQGIYGACLHLLEANLPPGLEPIEALIMAGADLTLHNRYGETPINSILRKGFYNAIRFFTSRNTDKKDFFDYGVALYTLIEKGQRTLPGISENEVDDLIQQLLSAKAYKGGYRKTDGNSLFHLAIEHDIPSWVYLLKSFGANLNQKNNAGQTPVDFFLTIQHTLKNADYIAKILELDISFNNNQHSLPASFKFYEPRFGKTQTTESESVKESVTQSIINLCQRYTFRIHQPNWINDNIQEIKDYLCELDDSLEKIYALQCIKKIENSNAQLDNYYCGMRQNEVLALVWEAVCDTDAVSDTKVATKEYINLRKSALIEHLATAETDDSGKRVCFTGVMHQIVTSLQNSHPDVQIDYDDRIVGMNASENILIFVEQYLKTYSLPAINAIYMSWDNECHKTNATQFRRDAREPVAALLRQTYGNSLNENSIRQIINAFDDLPKPNLKNILPYPAEPLLEPLYNELLQQLTYNNEIQYNILLEYHALINDILRMKPTYNCANRNVLVIAINLLCQRYIAQADLTFAQRRQYLNRDYRELITLYNKLSCFTQNHHNKNNAEDPVKQAAIQNINVTVKSACILFASGNSSAVDAEQYVKNNTIQICSAAIRKLSFFSKKVNRINLEEIIENVNNTIPDTPQVIFAH